LKGFEELKGLTWIFVNFRKEIPKGLNMNRKIIRRCNNPERVEYCSLSKFNPFRVAVDFGNDSIHI